ncbi:MAG: alpha/beta hydrolase [Paracoccus sp. (in: a-proteobacteria)]|nr:alpha/beta hydrolase [Paracoccus sp. (in: a-proteobacteria)]
MDASHAPAVAGPRHFPGDQDRPAIALHCMMGAGAGWARVARHLGGAVDLIAPDLPGHGDAPDWEGGDLDYHTDATRQIAALITRPVDLIGHSLGGTIALRIAVAYPEAVRSLTLIEPVLFAAAGPGAYDPSMAAAMPHIEAGDWDAAAASFQRVWAGTQAGAPRAPRAGAQARLLPHTRAALYEDSANILGEGRLEAIEAPVMLIAGEKSEPVMHDIHAALAARLMDVGRATIEGAGHMSPLTHPEQVAGLIALNLERS